VARPRSLDSLPRMRRAYLWSVAAIVTLVACGSPRPNPWREVRARPLPDAATSTTTPAPSGVYAAVTSTQPATPVADIPARVYVPNSASNTVDVIDPATFEIVDHIAVGRVPHHIAPAWDMSRLYVDNTYGDTLTVIDPRTGKATGTIPVTDPYNLYFTPDGSKAIVVAERYRRLDFRDPHTWALIKSLPIPGKGVDHLDFSADGSFLLATTEFSGQVVKVDVNAMEVVASMSLGSLPIDVKVAPDGAVFYITDQGRNGVFVVDPIAMKELAFVPTDKGAHGLFVSRDARSLYVSNRLAGSISVIDFATRRVTATWDTGGSPDMIQLSPDGTQLWVSGRFSSAVYVVDTTTGKLLHTIDVGREPHGLTYFPQPGRFSIGHNGVYR
jgi:YVTN family beta-propeller protein